ncbi:MULTISPECIES: acetyl-CoA C-acyltransferase [Lawsonibacter]|uniref:Acetyl-CoA acetyltransferase n=1 Tax=Lawsonibacter hominis TaxID=2763053 RepID=A0A8J6M9J9_9FIRM|nr:MULTISPECIES: acetyl-CoA C-acyltransferase [Lawsonibacter]MBS1383873.1 acetyl-CoA C-acyltransferase [Flavonifractor sp.]MDU2195429.1 acetyl-CoA C-acyltransferase [Clostridiales bacterium]MDY2976849.1 acetyl-CoA C-acyltransferase [Oscillospiraceae bacterium]MBC5734601.1 acetyl-CoA C-acyltransferase [Lawsonibacter hominis]MCI6398374.1 acetyl-CoA C-acyltransferase [Lawsonibacter sp.]
MKDAVIVALGRSAIGKAPKGVFRLSRPEDIGAQVLSGVLKQVPQLDARHIDDVIVGCAFPEAEQGMNLAKIVISKAIPGVDIPGQTVNRFCSSGLQTIATAANAIMAGQAEVIIAGGIELMSTIPMGGNIVAPNPDLIQSQPDAYTAMGITAENVAEQYGVTRRMQDEFSMESHRRANAARTEGKFAQEIIPVEAVTTYVDETGHTRMGLRTVAEDEGIRPQTTMESLGKLHTVFKLGGTVTPGNSSQTSDGAAFVILMSGEKAAELGVRPIAKFISFAVAGVPSELMGIGPIAAIPKALKIAGLRQEDMDIIELNEAFAAQSLACINTLGLDQKKVNVNGGAIAMGHPLGCTGSLLTVKVIRELQRRDGRYGMVSMCIGGGMGAAGVFERLP